MLANMILIISHWALARNKGTAGQGTVAYMIDTERSWINDQVPWLVLHPFHHLNLPMDPRKLLNLCGHIVPFIPPYTQLCL